MKLSEIEQWLILTSHINVRLIIDMLTSQGKINIKAVPMATKRTADRHFGSMHKPIASNGRLLSVVFWKLVRKFHGLFHTWFREYPQQQIAPVIALFSSPFQGEILLKAKVKLSLCVTNTRPPKLIVQCRYGSTPFLISVMNDQLHAPGALSPEK
jgi:hypothetical protein